MSGTAPVSATEAVHPPRRILRRARPTLYLRQVAGVASRRGLSFLVALGIKSRLQMLEYYFYSKDDRELP
jgi:hypothetical protein